MNQFNSTADFVSFFDSMAQAATTDKAQQHAEMIGNNFKRLVANIATRARVETLIDCERDARQRSLASNALRISKERRVEAEFLAERFAKKREQMTKRPNNPPDIPEVPDGASPN